MTQRRMRPIANRKMTAAAVTLLSATFLGYQNCGNQMQFDGEGLSARSAFDQSLIDGDNSGQGGSVGILPISDEQAEVLIPAPPSAAPPVAPGHPGDQPVPPVAGYPIAPVPPEVIDPTSPTPPITPVAPVVPVAPIAEILPEPVHPDVPPKDGHGHGDHEDIAEHDENDHDESEMEMDHDGKRIPFRCHTGVARGFGGVKDLKHAKDVTLVNKVGSYWLRKHVRNLTADRVRGNLVARKVQRVLRLKEVKGLVGLVVRAGKVDSATDLAGAVVSVAAPELGFVHDVKAGYACLGGETFAGIDGVTALAVKIRGVRTSASVGSATHSRSSRGAVVKNIKAGFISIRSADFERIENVNGKLILRGVEVRQLSGLTGELILINSKVHALTDYKGPKPKLIGRSQIGE